MSERANLLAKAEARVAELEATCKRIGDKSDIKDDFIESIGLTKEFDIFYKAEIAYDHGY